MSAAYVGEIVRIHFELTVDQIDTDATTISVSLTKPDGTTETLSPTHDGTGLYDEDYDTTGKPAGHYAWVAYTTGTAQAVSVGGFDLIDPTDSEQPLVEVAPWCDAADIRLRPNCDGISQPLLDDAARAATYVLWALSGRQFHGRRTVTVRPNARLRGIDAGSWAAFSGYGWFSSWGSCPNAIGYGYGAAALTAWAGHACCGPAELELGAYPVTQILEVKIDGTVIPADEYKIRDYRLLVRAKPTADAIPTARSGWPTCQRLDLPDTEPGTFSVRFAYGAAPPRAGVAAATSLAAELAQLWDNNNSDTRLPARVRTIARQGETITMVDPQDVLDKGRTGIPDVDVFIKAANPGGLTRRASAWSPDLGRASRITG